MNKIFVIGLPRTGTTSISAALLEYFKVAHTCYTKRAFELAEVISDCPCFSDYQQLDKVFPNSKFVYLERNIEQWLPSIQMLLNKMLPSFKSEAYINPVLKRSFYQTFDLENLQSPLEAKHLTDCYKRHYQQVNEYFYDRDDLLSIDVSQSDSFANLKRFLNIPITEQQQFPHLNIGKLVDGWKDIKHIHKINSYAAGTEGRKFFDYKAK